MARAAANEAQNAQATAGGLANTFGSNAQTLYPQLTTEAQTLMQSPGYSPATLSAITNAGMGGVNAAFGNAAGQINRNAALTKNNAGTAGQLDTLAMNKGIAGGQEAGNIQEQNAAFQNQQQMQGVNLLNGLYGSNMQGLLDEQGVQNQAINAQTSASPGWMQNLTGILSAVSQGAGAAVKACWVAAELYGGWDDPRVDFLRNWIFSTWWMRPFAFVYSKIGQEWASAIRTNKSLRQITKALFDWFLECNHYTQKKG